MSVADFISVEAGDRFGDPIGSLPHQESGALLVQEESEGEEDDGEVDTAQDQPSAPVTNVYPWIADKLEDCPSPGKGSPRRSLMVDPLRIPPDAALLKSIDALDAAFKGLSLNSTFKAVKDKKRSYAVHSLEAFDSGAVHDDAIPRINSSSLQKYSVPDSKLKAIETEVRRCYKPVSFVASLCQATLVAGARGEQVDTGRLLSIARATQDAITDIGNHLNTALANLTITRRLGALSLCSWPSEFRTELLRAPVSSSKLFADTIPTVAKDHAEATQTEVSLRTIQAVTKLESALRQPFPRYVPTRNSTRAAVASAYRGKPRRSRGQHQGQQGQQRHQPQQEPYSRRGSRSGGSSRGGHSGQRQ